MTSRLGEASWPELAEQPVTLLIPLGSTEQHGPHLPLDTDTRIAVAVAEGAARLRPDARVAPPLAYGASGEHAGFAGTLSLGTEVLSLAIIELVRSAGPEFSRIVLVNGHGGNHQGVSSARRLLHTEGRPVELWSPRLAGADAHAGRTETSLMLALAPDLVRWDRVEAGARAPLADLMGRLRAEGVRGVSPNGVLGDPGGASAEEGRRLMGELVDDLVELLERGRGRGLPSSAR